MAKRPTLVYLRQERRDTAELVLSHNGEALVVPLTFDQVRLLATRSTEAACLWPVEPAKAV